jgi:hypothetical protein
MRPITRALFTLCSAASLLVCAALILAWLTRNVGDAVRVRVVGNAILLFGADGGAVQLADAFYFNPDHPLNRGNYAGPTGLVWQLRAGGLAGTQATKHTIAGIEFYAGSYSPPSAYRAVLVPMAYPVTAAAALPFCWMLGHITRKRRLRGGCCVNCGYNLSATPDRCPECGTVPAKGNT